MRNKKMWHCLAVLLVVLLPAGSTRLNAVAAVLGNGLPQVPPAPHLDSELLRAAAWAAIACGADYLRTCAATNEMGLVVEPARKRWVRPAYTKRYREETYDHPIYEEKWEYEEVLVPKQGSMGEHRELVKVKRVIPGSVKRVQIGTEKRIRLVEDPNGSIVREYPAETYPEVWQRTFLGQNAMALFAMRKAGIPEDDPVVNRVAEFLNEVMNRFGLPDTTWDVAWLTAAFSQLGASHFRQNRDALVRKLLGGQIVDGPARGLWGPVCIDLPLLSVMVPYEQELAKELKKRRTMLAEKPDSKTLPKKVKEADGALGEFIRLYREVTQHGLRFEDCTQHWKVPDSLSADPLYIPGLPYYVFREQLADVECTALALYAIRQVAESGNLPENLERPKAATGSPILPAEKVSSILARATTALATLQTRDGRWSEGNVHQPITRFEPLGLRQLRKEEVIKIPAPVSDLATVQAYAALWDVGSVVGVDKLLGRFRTVVAAGHTARRAVSERFLSSTNDAPYGRYMTPYDFMFALREIDVAPDGLLLDRRDLWDRLVLRLLKMQDTTGAWGRGLALWQTPSLFWYEDEKICKPAHEKEQEKLPKDKRVPYDSKTAWKRRYIYAGRHVDTMDIPVVATTYSILLLADGLPRVPAGYFNPTNELVRPKLLDLALYHLKVRDNLTCPVTPITTNTPPSSIRDIPVLFTEAAPELTLPLVKSLLESYVNGAGVVAVELRDQAMGPTLEQALASLCVGGKAGDLKEQEAFLTTYQGVRPRLRAIYGAEGTPKIIFLPANETQGAYLLLKDRLATSRVRGEAKNILQSPDKTVKRVTLLQKLDEVAKQSEAKTIPPKARSPETVPTSPSSTSSQPAQESTPPPSTPPNPEDLKLPEPPPVPTRQPADEETW